MATVETYTSTHIDGLLQELLQAITRDYLTTQAADNKFITGEQAGVFLTMEDLAGLLSIASANGTYIRVVDAGTNLNVTRPTNAVAVLFRFSSGVNTGPNGENVTNAIQGDLFFVASA